MLMKKTTADFSMPAEINPSEIVDLRGLEAPEPIVRILTACTQMDADEHYVVHLPHVPSPLFPHLASRGLAWQVYEQVDDSALVVIRRST